MPKLVAAVAAVLVDHTFNGLHQSSSLGLFVDATLASIELDEFSASIDDEHISRVEALVGEGHFSHSHQLLALQVKQARAISTTSILFQSVSIVLHVLMNSP